MTSSRGGKSAARSGKSAASNREAETTTVGTTPPSKELTSKAATAIGKSKPRSTIARPQPTFEEISRRAYEIFLGRGGAPGDPMADWLQAERELSQKAFAR
ncbi:MAG: DUF2934 domain-containing protein [Phycisphaerae bacterium]|nr:DUF2934 domain-containing protein [Phycisphaerae bacterium]